jgi:pimeloyl-ACP methyl ester carboxylesterase
MAVQHPQLVARLFLYEPSLATFITDPAADRAFHDRLEMMRAAKEGNIDGAVEILMDDVNDHAGDFRRLPERVQSVTRQNSRTLSLLFNAPPPPPVSCADLRRLDFPTVIAVGGDSRAFYRIVSKAASQCIPGSRLVEVPNARHLWPVQDPAAFSRLVLDFLDNADRSAKRPPP